MNAASSVLEPPPNEPGSGGTSPPVDAPPGKGGGGGRDDRPERGGRGPTSVAVLGMWVALVPVLMLFLAFASAYIVRRTVGVDWNTGPLPRLLWVNTVVLLASSLALERARAVERAGRPPLRWILVTLALGVLFVIGQIFAWLEVRSLGFRMSTSAHTSFFYVLTGAHAAHVLGGLAGFVAAARWPEQGWRRASLGLVLRVVAIYWHFLLFLWFGLFALLFVLR